jgi:hypothetical protein
MKLSGLVPWGLSIASSFALDMRLDKPASSQAVQIADVQRHRLPLTPIQPEIPLPIRKPHFVVHDVPAVNRGERSNVRRYNTGTDPYEDGPDVEGDDERDVREYGHGKTRAEVYLSNDTALCYHDPDRITIDVEQGECHPLPRGTTAYKVHKYVRPEDQQPGDLRVELECLMVWYVHQDCTGWPVKGDELDARKDMAGDMPCLEIPNPTKRIYKSVKFVCPDTKFWWDVTHPGPTTSRFTPFGHPFNYDGPHRTYYDFPDLRRTGIVDCEGIKTSSTAVCGEAGPDGCKTTVTSSSSAAPCSSDSCAPVTTSSTSASCSEDSCSPAPTTSSTSSCSEDSCSPTPTTSASSSCSEDSCSKAWKVKRTDAPCSADSCSPVTSAPKVSPTVLIITYRTCEETHVGKKCKHNIGITLITVPDKSTIGSSSATGVSMERRVDAAAAAAAAKVTSMATVMTTKTLSKRPLEPLTTSRAKVEYEEEDDSDSDSDSDSDDDDDDSDSDSDDSDDEDDDEPMASWKPGYKFISKVYPPSSTPEASSAVTFNIGTVEHHTKIISPVAVHNKVKTPSTLVTIVQTPEDNDATSMEPSGNTVTMEKVVSVTAVVVVVKTSTIDKPAHKRITRPGMKTKPLPTLAFESAFVSDNTTLSKGS